MSPFKTSAAPFRPGWRTDELLVGAAQHIAGTALVLAAWLLVFTGHDAAAASALLPGLVILALTAANQIRHRAAGERAVAIAGAWTVLAPWLIGFAANDAATWAHLAFGGMALACAITWLRIARPS